MWVLLQRLPVPGCFAGPATRVLAGAARHVAYRVATCARAGRAPPGKNASGPFLAGGAVAPTPTFLVRDNAAKSEGSNPRSSRAF